MRRIRQTTHFILIFAISFLSGSFAGSRLIVTLAQDDNSVIVIPPGDTIKVGVAASLSGTLE